MDPEATVMTHQLCSHLTAGIAVAVASLTAVPSVAPPAPPAPPAPQIQLTGTDSPLGDGTAFVIGGSTIAVPPPGYVDAADSLYLQPLGFDGTAQGLFTPEGLYPVTGVKSLPLDTSLAQGQQILEQTIQQQIAAGHVDAANPVVVFGWSQSAVISSLLMPTLAKGGIPSDDMHFVLVGDPSAPAGGMLERFHVPINGVDPTVPTLGITFSGATPSDLYPTDIYTVEYALFADFPRYPINFLSDLNAYLGIIEHASYPLLTPDQLASAIQLPTSAADPLTNYYMIPSEALPLLVPLQFLPFIGQPLYDLLEPDMRILVKLGYGSIDQGWDTGPADVPTPFGLFPTDLNPGDVLTALANGVPAGIEAAVQQLANPANYDLSTILDNPVLTELVSLMNILGFTDATELSQLTLPELLQAAQGALGELVNFPTSDASLFSSSPTEIVNSVTGTLAGDYATLLPIADSVNTLLTTVPSTLVSFVADQLAQGNILDAIGDPIAVFVGLAPFAAIYGVGVPLVEALGGTLVNVAELVGLGG